MEGIIHSPPFKPSGHLSSTVRDGPDEVYVCSVHGNDILPTGVTAISHDLSRYAPRALFYSFHRRHEFLGVIGALAYGHIDDDPRDSIGRQLHVISRSASSI
jgi:hypothetical protein